MIYVFLADGFEEIEALAPTDILRRAGLDVKLCGIGCKKIKGVNGIEITCDTEISEAEQDLDAVILPGGMPGAENLFKSERLREIVNHCAKSNKLVAAICAAPIILGRLGLLEGKNACCYPAPDLEKELKGAKMLDKPVCVDGNIVTSKGPGTSLEFGFKIAEILKGSEAASKLRASMQCM